MSNVKFSCAPNKVVLRKIETETKEDLVRKEGSGIIEKKTGASLEHKGEVLVVGNAIDWIKPGDVVVHGHHSGTVFASRDFLPEDKRTKTISAEQKLEQITGVNQSPIIGDNKSDGIGVLDDFEALLSLNDYEVLLVSSPSV